MMDNTNSANRGIKIASVVLLVTLIILLALVVLFAAKVGPVLFRIFLEHKVQLPFIIQLLSPLIKFLSRYCWILTSFSLPLFAGAVVFEATYKNYTRKIIGYSLGIMFASFIILFYCFLTILTFLLLQKGIIG